MGAFGRGSLPPDLARGRNRFQAWREQRTGRGRIPRSLWALAVQLANVHGVSRTAAVLGLDSHSLKMRAEAVTSEAPSSPPAFVVNDRAKLTHYRSSETDPPGQSVTVGQ